MKVTVSNKAKRSSIQKSCTKCGKIVVDLPRHMKRIHETKTWGYKCPLCGFFASRYNKCFMTWHLKSEHMNLVDVANCKFDVPQGYTGLFDCDLCNFMCLSQFDLDVHKADHLCSTLEIHTPSLGDDFEIKDEISMSNKFEELLNKTEELLQNSKLE